MGVDGLPAGVHLHRPDAHSLEKLVQGDVRAELAAAALDQESVARAPAVLVVVATPERLRERFIAWKSEDHAHLITPVAQRRPL